MSQVHVSTNPYNFNAPPENQSGFSCCFECVSECFFPSVATLACCCIPFYFRDCSNRVQLYSIRHPTGLGCIKLCCYMKDMTYDCMPSKTVQMFQNRRNMYGKGTAYCSFNKVVITDSDEAERLLVNPADRGIFLGLTDFKPSHITPNPLDNNRSNFLLTMNGTGENNDHDAFRKAFMSLSASPACLARAREDNPVMINIMNRFRVELNRCKSTKDVTTVAIPMYLLRVIHWTVLELDLIDNEYSTLYEVYYGGRSPSGPNSVLWHLRLSNLITSNHIPQFDRAIEIYKRSPLLAGWVLKPEFNMLPVSSIMMMLTRAFAVAGLQGPLDTLSNFVQRTVIPQFYPISVKDRNHVKLLLLESMRLCPPVNGTTVVPSKPVSCPFHKSSVLDVFKPSDARKMVTIPASTPCNVNYYTHAMDENVWEDPLKFNPLRSGLSGPDSRFVNFNGVGDAGPRLCPGRDIAMEVMATAVTIMYSGEFPFIQLLIQENGVETVGKTEDEKKESKDANAIFETLDGIFSLVTERKAAELYVDPFDDRLDKGTQAWIFVAADLSTLTAGAPPRDSRTITEFSRNAPLDTEVLILRERPLIHFRFAEKEEDASQLKQLMKFGQRALILQANAATEDRDIFYHKSLSDAMAAGKGRFGKVLPQPEVVWDVNKIDTSEGLSLFVFHGLGQVYLTTVRSARRALLPAGSNAVYEVDLEFACNYGVRTDFERYGAVAFFDANRQPIGIWWCGGNAMILASHPPTPEWVHAMAVLRSTVIMVDTVKEHLCFTHMVISNGFMLACREALSKHHPVRRLLKPHHFGATSVNFAAKSALLTTNGIAFQVFGIDKVDFPRALADCVSLYKYETFPEFIAGKGLSERDIFDVPFARDGIDFWNIVHSYVNSYMKIFYPNGDSDILEDADLLEYWNHFSSRQLGAMSYGLPGLKPTFAAVVDQITHSIFGVTAGHEMYGSVTEYLLSPNVVPPKLKVGRNIADVETFYLSLCLMSMTSAKMPMLIEDWSHLHDYIKDESVSLPTISKADRGKLHMQVIGVLAKFQSDLVAFAVEVDNRNVERLNDPKKMPFNACNPRFLECSVSV